MKDFFIYIIGTIIVILFLALLVYISDIQHTKKEGNYTILLDDNRECIIKYRSSKFCFNYPWEFESRGDFFSQSIRTDTTFWCDGSINLVGHIELAHLFFAFIAGFSIWIFIFLTTIKKP